MYINYNLRDQGGREKVFKSNFFGKVYSFLLSNRKHFYNDIVRIEFSPLGTSDVSNGH